MAGGLIRIPRAVVGAALRCAALAIVVAAVVFVLADLLPGDATAGVLERGASAGAVADARAELGLDRPLVVRLGDRLLDLARGDLGTTARGASVADVVGEPLERTLVLSGLAFALVAVVSVPLGAVLAWRAGTASERVASAWLTALLCLPELVVLTLLAAVLSAWLGWLPAVVVPAADGSVPAQALVLPVLALALPATAWTAHVVRGAVADALALPHVETAVLAGLSPTRVVARHALPPALPTIAASLATTCAALLGGAIVVEAFVNYPGLGSVLTQGVESRDVGLVTGVVVLVALVMAMVFSAADLARRLSAGERYA